MMYSDTGLRGTSHILIHNKRPKSRLLIIYTHGFTIAIEITASLPLKDLEENIKLAKI